MKAILLFIVLLLSAAAFCQSNVQQGQSYVLGTSVSAEPWNYTDNVAAAKTAVLLERGYKYTLTSITSDNKYAIIELWRFERPKNRMLKRDSKELPGITVFEKIGQQLNQYRYFRVLLTDLNANSIPFSGLTPIIGTLTLPVKLRFGYGEPGREFDFSKDVALAASFAIRKPINHGLNQQYTTFVLATGFSSIALDSLTAPVLGKRLDASGYTLALGYMYEFKTGQIGLFTGVDLLGRNKERYGWVYQGLPWISIGIGINIFAPANSSPGSRVQTVSAGGSK
jgi:hypothetical protein